MYKDIHQRRLCSARLEASSDQKTEGFSNNNQRGRGSRSCLIWVCLDKFRHIVSIALLVRVQFFRKDLYKAVEGPSTRPIVLSMITTLETIFREIWINVQSMTGRTVQKVFEACDICNPVSIVLKWFEYILEWKSKTQVQHLAKLTN